MEMIDVFCHWTPPRFAEMVMAESPAHLHMMRRALAMKTMSDLETRFRIMDGFPGYRQIPSLASPPLEETAEPEKSAELARIANDEMAEIVAKHPDRFAGFVAALPMNAPEAAAQEAERAVTALGAPGVQIFTNVLGKPLDRDEFFPLFETMRRLDRPIWIHPARNMKAPDYADEDYSKYELWWALGWPYETSVAMYRLVFSGLFEKLPGIKIIVHHGGAMFPMVEGRLGSGLELYGTRTPPRLKEKETTPLKGKPLDGCKQFYADAATFGSKAALECAVRFFTPEHMIFATDMPFDPEQGPRYIRETIDGIHALPLSSKEKTAIFSTTIRTLCCLKNG